MRIGKMSVEESHFVGLSFATSLLSGAVKLAVGAVTRSPLVLMNAAYNAVLCVPKALALASGRLPGARRRCGRACARPQHPGSETGIQLFAAASLVALGAVFLAFSNHALVNGETLHMDKIPAISFATCAFAKIGVSVYGLVREWGNKDGIVFSCKLANFADGLASIALTQTALRGIEGEGGDVWDAALGIAVGIVIAALGIWQLAHAARRRNASATAPTEAKRNDAEAESRPASR